MSARRILDCSLPRTSEPGPRTWSRRRCQSWRRLSQTATTPSNIVVVVTGLDVVGSKAFAEWVLEADHTGPLVIDDIRVEPTGRRLQVGGATIADFRHHRIEAFRTYFDSIALLEQMVE